MVTYGMRKIFAYHPNAPQSTVAIAIPEAKKLGSGATAHVYQTRFQQKDVAVKVYSPEAVPPSAKLKSMVMHPPENIWLKYPGGSHPQLAWPAAMLRNTAGKDVGFLMPLIDSNKFFSIDHFYDSTLLPRLKDPEQAALSYKIEIARNLARLTESLHEQGHYFVDVKPQNILVSKHNHLVSLLDCDGFSVKSANERFNASLVSTDYISPEAYREKLKPSKLGEAQDLYALAVIFFQLLNGGTHPFQGIVKAQKDTGTTNDEKAAIGLYPHGLEANPQIGPRPQSIHHLWDDKTRQLFDRAFSSISRGRRPTAKIWAQHFETLLNDKGIQGCDKVKNNVRHMRFVGKQCPACYVENLPKRNKRKRNISKSNFQQPYVKQSSRSSFYNKKAPIKQANQRPSIKKPDNGSSDWWIFYAVILVLVIIIAVNSG